MWKKKLQKLRSIQMTRSHFCCFRLSESHPISRTETLNGHRGWLSSYLFSVPPSESRIQWTVEPARQRCWMMEGTHHLCRFESSRGKSMFSPAVSQDYASLLWNHKYMGVSVINGHLAWQWHPNPMLINTNAARLQTNANNQYLSIKTFLVDPPTTVNTENNIKSNGVYEN